MVAVIALIVLGPDRLPKAARQLGKAIGEFKKFSAGVQAQVDEVIRETSYENYRDGFTSPETKPKSEGGPSEEVEGEANSDYVADSEKSTERPDIAGFRLIDSQSPAQESEESVPDERVEKNSPPRKPGKSK